MPVKLLIYIRIRRVDIFHLSACKLERLQRCAAPAFLLSIKCTNSEARHSCAQSSEQLLVGTWNIFYNTKPDSPSFQQISLKVFKN